MARIVRLASLRHAARVGAGCARRLRFGAGPAGLQLANYLEANSRSYAILESGSGAGSFYRKYPRHGRLLSINKVHTGHSDPELNMRWDWNSLLTEDQDFLFRDYDRDYFPSADSLVRYLGDFAERFELKVRCGTRVEKIRKDELFHVTDQHGSVFHARTLILATGLWLPYVPPISGIELAECYNDVSVDPEDFAGQVRLRNGPCHLIARSMFTADGVCQEMLGTSWALAH